jgi:predicted hotdog family 3-hydroxylacyl-ACP dehydratase
MPYELATGARQGRTRASLRVFAGDAETGLTDAFVALPHDPPARVVGFPAWTIEQGLVCSIVSTRADPFVVQAARVEDPAVDPRRAVALPHAPAVDAIACLEWIAQAAAWWGHVAAPGEEARPAVARSGAVLATRELRLARRWLSVGETYRVIVRCVGRARGLARFEGIVTCERGRCVASADLLVRTSGDLDGVVGGEKPPHRA